MEQLKVLRIKADYEEDLDLSIADAEKSLELCESILEDLPDMP